jgi:hypothetical protein
LAFDIGPLTVLAQAQAHTNRVRHAASGSKCRLPCRLRAARASLASNPVCLAKPTQLLVWASSAGFHDRSSIGHTA